MPPSFHGYQGIVEEQFRIWIYCELRGENQQFFFKIIIKYIYF